MGEKMPDRQLTGLCGEHYVAAYLAGSDLTVAVPRGGAARVDLFVADSRRGRPIRLQVKTARDPYGKHQGKPFCSWATNCSIIDEHDEGYWFAFVALNGWPQKAILPEVLFVPSAVVAERMELEKAKTRTFYWIYVDDAEIYRNENGLALLKTALAQPCQSPPPSSPPAIQSD